MPVKDLPPFLKNNQSQKSDGIPPFLKKKESGTTDSSDSSEDLNFNGLSITTEGLNVPTLSTSSIENILNPVNTIASKQVTTPKGVTFNIDENKLPAPMRTATAVKDIQEQINTGVNSPELQTAISSATGKSINAVNAYLNGDNKTGSAIDRMDYISSNKLALKNTILNLNNEAGTSYNPDEVLTDPDKLSTFIQDWKTKMSSRIAQNTSHGIFDPERRFTDPATKGFSEKLFSDFQNFQQPVLNDHLIKTTVQQDWENRVAPEVTNEKIAYRTNPVNYKNSKNALSKKTGLDYVSDNATPGEVVGAIIDEIKGTDVKDEILNSVIGQADIQRNNALLQLALDKNAEAHLTGDESASHQAKQLAENYNPDLIYKYPSILKQQMAMEISQDVARDSGQLEGYEGEGGAHNAGVKFLGETQAGYAKRMQDKGWFSDPRTKDVAMSLLNQPELFSDASYLGSAGNAFLKPFKDLGLSVSDILNVRNQKDIQSDKIKDENFPQETPGITPFAKGVRNIVNTTSNLAGMATIAALTGGIGRAAGIGLSEAEAAELSTVDLASPRGVELASKISSSKNKIETLSNAASFGLPSVDQNLKDSYNFIENDAARTLYVTMGAMLNTYGGKLLNVGALSKIPVLNDTFIKAATELSEKKITQDAARELLNEGRKPYVDWLMKYGKNVTEGAATMAYFTATNEILKSAYGDPNTTSDDVIKNTGSAFLDGVLGMLVFGAVKTAGEYNENANSSFKHNIYNMAIMPDAAKDVFLLAKTTDEDYAQKVQIINTAVAAKNALEAAQNDAGIELSPEQKSVYVANKTAEAYVRAVAEKTTDESKKTELLSRADRLRDQSVSTLDGLKFTKTLEPLYDLYNAEKEYDKAYADFQKKGDEYNQRVLEQKKKVYDDLQNKYFDDKYGGVVNSVAETTKQETKPVETKVANPEPVAPEDNITVGDMLDKSGNYKGQRGQFYVDGQTVIFKPEGKNREYELGNVNEIKDSSIKDYGIEHEDSVVEITENGNYKVRDNEYVNNFSDPLLAINRGKNGEVVSVNLDTVDGKKRTFRGNIAEDLAYQISLKEITKDNETRDKFEQFINEDESTKKEMDASGLSETAKETADQNNAEVSREKIEPVSEKQTTFEPSEKSISVFDAIDNADRSKKSMREKERAVESSVKSFGELGAKALEIHKNFGDIVNELKRQNKLEVKC